MTDTHFAVVREAWPGRTFCFLKPLHDPSHMVFFSPRRSSLDKNLDYSNGTLVVYELGADPRGRPIAIHVRRARSEEAAPLEQVGFIHDYDPARDCGHVVSAGGEFFHFKDKDLAADIETFYEGDEILFVPNVSERHTKFALLIRKPDGAATPQENAA